MQVVFSSSPSGHERFLRVSAPILTPTKGNQASYELKKITEQETSSGRKDLEPRFVQGATQEPARRVEAQRSDAPH